MKLELKHIVGYLPYGLQCKNLINDEIDTINWADFNKNFIGRSEEYSGESEDFVICGKIEEYKPILKSELSEEEKKQVSIKAGFGGHLDGQAILDGKAGYIGIIEHLDVIQFLYSIHYDPHNLIPQGLAIDEKTIKT